MSFIEIIQVFLLLLPFFLLALCLKKSRFKGFFGEFIINFKSVFFLDKNYQLISNVTLPTEGGSTQIDHIIVSKYGLFVIETKNLKGEIFGHPLQKRWTQKIHNHSYQFQNPLHQNYKHIKTLEALLKINQAEIFSLIVFVGHSHFKTAMPHNVIDSKAYIGFIKSKTKVILTHAEIIKITKKISSHRLTASFKTNQAHIKHVKNIIAHQQIKPKCPKCGSDMIERKALQGKNKGKIFWGCTQFPKCRGVVSIG